MASSRSFNFLSVLKNHTEDMAAISQLLDLLGKLKAPLTGLVGVISCLPVVFGGFLGNEAFFKNTGMSNVSQLPIQLRFVIFLLLITCFGLTFGVVIDWLERLHRDYRKIVVLLLALFAGYVTVSLSDWLYPAVSDRSGHLPLFLIFVGVGLVALVWFARLRFQRVGCTSVAVLACRGRALFWTPLWVTFFTTLVLVVRD
jgi:hypothetical protein